MHNYVEGVDVSQHQGAIDWRALSQTSVRFAYMKASEGGDHVDGRFAFNWREASGAGLLRGAYHFFTLCRPGAQQAQHFLDQNVYEDGALPPAVDIEQKHACRRGPTMNDVVGEVRAFLDRVQSAIGIRPLLYTTREFHDLHLKNAFAEERFWIRSLFTPPRFRTRQWVIWQHHNRAHRAGVSTPVDLNSFRGDHAALLAFAGLNP
jgi:lysozyme